MEDLLSRLEFTVFGFVRKTESIQLHDHLVQVILLYCDSYFRFKNNDSDVFQVQNNGFTICSQQDRYGTIRCGDYLSANDRVIHTITFELLGCEPSGSGIGFITDKFSNWEHDKSVDPWNVKDSQSMWLSGNGFYRTSQPFSNDLKESCTFIKYEWYCQGDKISVRINTISGEAMIWNNVVDIENLRGDESNYVFFLKLPLQQTRFALSLFMGDQTQSIRIIDQQVLMETPLRPFQGNVRIDV